MTRDHNTAKRIIEVLEQGTSSLDRDTLDRLAVARQRALSARHASGAKAVIAGVGHFFHEHTHGQRAWLSGLIVILAALLIVMIMQQQNAQPPVTADTLLLASELPPEAYVDEGFHAWLENSSVL